MKHLFLFTLAFVFSCINVSAQTVEKLVNDDSIINIEVSNLVHNQTESIKMPAFDTNYFYKSNGVIDTTKILTDTTFHWGGVFFEIYDGYGYNQWRNFYYGQYIIDKDNGRKKPIGKCLLIYTSYHIQDERGNSQRNKNWNQVESILYYDNEGNFIRGVSIGFTNRKIIGIFTGND